VSFVSVVLHDSFGVESGKLCVCVCVCVMLCLVCCVRRLVCCDLLLGCTAQCNSRAQRSATPCSSKAPYQRNIRHSPEQRSIAEFVILVPIVPIDASRPPWWPALDGKTTKAPSCANAPSAHAAGLASGGGFGRAQASHLGSLEASIGTTNTHRNDYNEPRITSRRRLYKFYTHCTVQLEQGKTRSN
jgi:hypothetical protein